MASNRQETERKRGNEDEIPPFHVLFDRHFLGGTTALRRLGEPAVPWTAKTLGKRISECHTKKIQPTPRTVANWCNGSVPPTEENLNAICEVFFGLEPSGEAQTADRTLRAAWHKEKIHRQPGRTAAKQSRQGADSQADADWLIDPPILPLERLFEMTLHNPPQGSTQDAFEVLLTLLLGPMPVADAGLTADIRLRRFFLSFQSANHVSPLQSRFRKGPDFPSVTALPGGWEFDAGEDGVLHGPIPGLDVLMQLIRKQAGAAEVTLTAWCRQPTDVKVEILHEAEPLPKAAEAILRTVFQTCLQNEKTGETRLGEVSMRSREKSG